ncbi:ABC transporter permease [Prosthecomicrobium sp. N25]|uniref:ABC transporter permease n=1 Tax=Prosthecomicrobium sp. N25 TaxID=3129254 RepID=UPI0030784922
MTEATAAELDLVKAHARAERGRRRGAFLLVAPLLVFLVFTFLVPIGDMLRRSFLDGDVASVWPRTVAVTRAWDGGGEPPALLWPALAADIKASAAADTVAVAARRVNYAVDGGRTLVMKTARQIGRIEAPPNGDWRTVFAQIDPAWIRPETTRALRRASGPVTDFYLLSALDLRKTETGAIVSAPERDRIYRTILQRTFSVAGLVTLLTLLIGYPYAYLMTRAGRRVAALMTVFVLLPFWTSLLVRTAAWIVLLQDQGILNNIMLALGIVDQPLRLIFNRVGVVVAMTHVLLPFMVLPLAAVMRGIRPETVRAARSLGATPATAFRRIYFPQTLPGVAAGALLVFISAIGYYITPALVGGADDQMISWFIAFFVNDTINWGLAAALGVVLLGCTAVLSILYARIAGGRRLA